MPDKSMLKIPVRAKRIAAFHSENKQNQNIYNLICERELPARDKYLKLSATASKQKEKESSCLCRWFHGGFWIQARKDVSNLKYGLYNYDKWEIKWD